MIQSRGYAAQEARARLAPFAFERRDPRPHDVVVEIQYCGVCHSDIHQVRNEWNESVYPMVPGHEIVGRVLRGGSVGQEVQGWGDRRESACWSIRAARAQAAEPAKNNTAKSARWVPITGGIDRQETSHLADTRTILLRMRASSSRFRRTLMQPLLHRCCVLGSRLIRRFGIGRLTGGRRVGVVGLGGLGHMGLKFAHAQGAHVVQFTTSPSKKDDALRLGADEVVLSNDSGAMKSQGGSFDFILDTVSAPHDIDIFLSMLKRNGTMALVGLPDRPLAVQPAILSGKRVALSGSSIGGVAETQQMLDYCGEQGIVSDIEMIPHSADQ